jgi:hypothetical protein
MILKTGLTMVPGPACPGRPLSEAAVANLAAALDRSPLANTLLDITGLPGLIGRERAAAFHATQRRGRPNTSGTATLVWQSASGNISPFQVTARIVAPDQYGHPHIRTLGFTVEVTSRLTAWQAEPDSPMLPAPGARRRLETQEWLALLEAIIATLTSPEITAVLADLADVDPLLVPPARKPARRQPARDRPVPPAAATYTRGHRLPRRSPACRPCPVPVRSRRQSSPGEPVAPADCRRRRAHRHRAPHEALDLQS